MCHSLTNKQCNVNVDCHSQNTLHKNSWKMFTGGYSCSVEWSVSEDPVEKKYDVVVIVPAQVNKFHLIFVENFMVMCIR